MSLATQEQEKHSRGNLFIIRGTRVRKDVKRNEKSLNQTKVSPIPLFFFPLSSGVQRRMYVRG
jgi:hypothetical protein